MKISPAQIQSIVSALNMAEPMVLQHPKSAHSGARVLVVLGALGGLALEVGPLDERDLAAIATYIDGRPR